MPATSPPETRFWPKVRKGDDCWEWIGTKIQSGYGMICIDGKMRPAHRLSYTMHKGPIPKGLVLDHLCRNRGCVNPDHLEAVTARENILRGEGLAARQAKQTHCKYGHPLLSLDDYYPYGKHRRVRHCKRCARAYSRDRSRARKEGRAAYSVRELHERGMLE